MPTANQIDQANYAAMKAREAAAADDQGPRVAGVPVGSAEEGAQVESITNFQRPALGNIAWEAVQPRNIIPTIAEGVTGAVTKDPAKARLAGRLVQPISTAAQRMSEGKNPIGEGYLGDLTTNAIINEVGNKVGQRLGKVAGWIGQSAPAQSLRSSFAHWAMGKVTPDAMDALRFSGEMIGDVEKAVNAVRTRQGKPAYSREAIEAKLGRHLQQLQDRGAFTIPELTGGNKVDALEPLASGSIAGKGTFISKQEGKDALMEGWPKVWASMLGEESPGPDDLAAIAAMSIESSLRSKQAAAGGAMQAVENVVGGRDVPIDESLLDPLQRQLELFAKRYKTVGSARQIKLDPEGIDAHLNNAIGIVERATGKKFDIKTGQFVEDLDPKIAALPPQVIATMRAQGAIPPPQTEGFTFSNIKTLKSALDEIQAKLPEGEKNQANATLGSFSNVLRGKLDDVLAAEDAATGATGAASLKQRWDSASGAYGRAMALRKGFQAQGMIDSLKEAGSGAKVLREIWPDDADINRIGALKELMGGEKSPYWQQMRRFKVEQMLEDKTGSPDSFVQFLTDSKQHSLDYWHEVLGKDQYDRVLKFAKTLEFARRKNPFTGEAGLPRRVEAGYLMRFAGPGAIGALGVVNPGAAAGAAVGAGSWLIATRKIAQWLTNPNDSAMFLHLASGKPLGMKQRAWLRNEIGRAVAASTMDEQPDIRPVPATATRAGYGAATGRVVPVPTAANGIRG